MLMLKDLKKGVEWFDESGVKYVKNLAFITCIQIDHLDGILFIDHLSTLKRKWQLKK